MKYLMMLIAALALTACDAIVSPFDDGYEFGDTTRSALALQAKYCAEADPYRRAVILAMLNNAGLVVPPSGACTDLLELVPEPDLEAIDADVEQAIKDQERFKNVPE